jgi:ADP-ribose pyrophosphatase YjhB (NUDIX family)
VTTRGQRGWIIPKGWPIRHLTAASTAAREAYEEAGAIGTIVGDRPCGSFIYEKRASSRGRVVCEVSVFLLEVERQLRKWPEKSQRKTRWFTPEAASRLVVPSGFGEILRTDLVRLVNRTALSGPEPEECRAGRVAVRVSRPHPHDDLAPRKATCVQPAESSPFQNILSANRKRTIANMAKNAAISPLTTQKPFGLLLNGIPPTFMPQIPAISVAGRNIAENIVSM